MTILELRSEPWQRLVLYFYELTLCIFVVIYEIRIKAQKEKRKSENYVVFIVSEIKIDSG